jgi:hypothetical protein
MPNGVSSLHAARYERRPSSPPVLPVRWHLVMLALFVLTPQIILGGYLAHRNSAETQASVESATNALARTITESVDREFAGVIGVLQGLATSPALRRRDFAEFYPQVDAAFKGRKASGVAIRDALGRSAAAQ